MAEDVGFDVIITSDQNIRHQQKLGGRKFALVVLGLQFQRGLRVANFSRRRPASPSLLRLGVKTLDSCRPGLFPLPIGAEKLVGPDTGETPACEKSWRRPQQPFRAYSTVQAYKHTLSRAWPCPLRCQKSPAMMSEATTCTSKRWVRL